MSIPNPSTNFTQVTTTVVLVQGCVSRTTSASRIGWCPSSGFTVQGPNGTSHSHDTDTFFTCTEIGIYNVPTIFGTPDHYGRRRIVQSLHGERRSKGLREISKTERGAVVVERRGKGVRFYGV